MIHFTLVVIIVNPVAQAPSPTVVQEQPIVQDKPYEPDPGLIWMTCPDCTWRGGYDSMTSAKLGIAGHRSHCKRGRKHKKHLFG